MVECNGLAGEPTWPGLPKSSFHGPTVSMANVPRFQVRLELDGVAPNPDVLERHGHLSSCGASTVLDAPPSTSDSFAMNVGFMPCYRSTCELRSKLPKLHTTTSGSWELSIPVASDFQFRWLENLVRFGGMVGYCLGFLALSLARLAFDG